MHQEKYSLKWHTYSDHLKSMMKELMMNEDFSDITLVTEDKKQIKANISILSACSPVFKDILKKEKNSNQIMYLRGIQFSEMESIMQFIYLGEATFFEERMDEFIAVAKLLGIKELCKAEPKSNYEADDEPTPSDPVTSTEEMGEETDISDHFKMPDPQASHKRVVSVSGTLNCHKQSVHEGVKYACDRCEQQFAHKIGLTRHIQSKHEGIKYACDQCDKEFIEQNSLKRHIHSMHEGDKFDCNYCDHQATRQSNLLVHIKKMHGGQA